MRAKSKTSRERIYASLLKDILRGNLIPGEKLSEEKLAKKFKVSRTPVREAIFQLENEGYIERKANKGCFIKKISRNQVEEILDVVGQLEGYASALLATNKAKKEDITYLHSLQAEMEIHAKKNDYFRYIEKNREFHDYFPKICGNHALHETVSNLRDRVHRRTKYLSLTLSTHIDIYSQDHKKMIEAISEGKP